MHPAAGRRAADPLAGAIGQGRAAIEAHGPLQQAPGAARANAVQEGAILLGGFGLAHAADHLNPCGFELGDAAAGHTGIGISQGNHHPAQARSNHRF